MQISLSLGGDDEQENRENPPEKEKEKKTDVGCEFEPVAPTLLKNPLDARWGLLPTLRWVDSCLNQPLITYKPVEGSRHQEN